MRSKFLHRTLANGLTIVGEVNSANASSAIGFFVRTGARDEQPQESGVSHFLEHMVFKGTPTRSAIEINLELGNLGAQANAFTSEENTVYYAGIIPEHFAQMQELLSDMLRPLLDSQEFDTEKKVILEEIALYQDRPQFYLFENASLDFFAGHPAGNSVLGSVESITALQRDQMKGYLDRRYSPSNTVLAATGNFSWDEFVARAERLCGSWVDFPVQRTTLRYAGRVVQREFRRKNLSHAHALLIAPGVSAQDPERYPMTLLAMIVGDSTGSRLYWELIHTGLADSAGVESDERDGTGCFLASVSTTPQQLDSVVAIVRKVLATPLDFSEDDLERAKTKLIARIVLDGELPMGRLMALGLEWTYRRENTPLSEVIARVRSVSRADIQRALEKFPLSAWAEYRLLPEG